MKRIIIAAATAAAVVLGIAGVAFASASSAAARVRIPVAYNGADGWSGGAVRLPTVYIGESNVFLRTPHWRHWSKSSASGQGTLWVNTCSPTCAAGHYRKYPATVRLGGAATHNGVPYFSRLTLSYVHGHERTYSYRWGDLPGATLPGWNGGPAS